MYNLTVSIIIPVFNEEDVISHCLKSCLEQKVLPKEIIVVNNNSTDNTMKIVEQYAQSHKNGNLIKTVIHKEQGLIGTRNKGFAVAKGDIYGRIDADTYLRADWVKTLQEAFQDSQIMGVSGPVLYYDMPFGEFGLKADLVIRKIVLGLNKKYKFLFGSNMAIRAAAWEKIKKKACLDKEDLFHEDIDLSLHLKEADLKIEFLPNLVAGISARRMSSPPKEYHNYVKRFSRTYNAHNVKAFGQKTPEYILMSIYPPLHILHKTYEKRFQRKGGVNKVAKRLLKH
ncbi:MAG: glycosyltransferase [Bifidobacteriaceae bacterium]|jgi:cellulose synthase/poly-beta-1,6-N-acetylglucosamine synthase-like glycosyltransferase|nr:glycosyltransferase [Bifidobacteriaceae bacterium]